MSDEYSRDNRAASLPFLPNLASAAVPTAGERSTGSFADLLPLLGLGAAIVAGIAYVFPPGSPQPGDALLLVTIVATVVLANVKLPRVAHLYTTLGLFLSWVIFVNTTWFVLLPDPTFLRKTIFYIYNAVVLIYVVALGIQNYERLRKTVYWGCIAALGVELIYMELFYTSTKLRALGTFNNPNQLGYWSLLMMACLGVALWGRRLRVLDIVALLTAAYCIAHSLSKAAMFAGALMLLVTVFSCRWHRKAVLATVALALIASGVELVRGGVAERLAGTNLVTGVQLRLGTLGKQRDDSLWERGYSRLVLHPQYLAFGAGEGAFIRLSDEENDKEFHSTLGNVLMSYGVIGLSFLLSLFFVVFRRATLSSMCLFLPLMLYGITHMGLRDTMLWVFLGLVFAHGQSVRAGMEAAPPASFM
jgi:hypothetical protein